MTSSRDRPRALYFGQVALKYRFVDLQQLEECLATQEAILAAGEAPRKLGEIMVDHGMLTAVQVQRIFKLQGRVGGHQEVEGYEVFGPVGSGGMGTVYRAKQSAHGRTVALKILLPRLAQDPEYVKRFVREARAAAMLKHPNIVAGLDVGESNGLFYFAMEYVEGETLARVIQREGAVLEARALTITLQIAGALCHAAGRGLVHGDVKPGNVIITENGSAKLCDLGLARLANSAVRGAAMGTPTYVAPEQALGEDSLDSRADIYSLGATLFHMVTGHHPFYGTTTRILSRQLQASPRPPREMNTRLSVACDGLITRMMAKRRTDRHQNPGEVVDEIREILGRRHAGSGEPGEP